MKYVFTSAAVLVIFSILSSGCQKSKSVAKEPVTTVDVALPVVDSVVVHKSYPGLLTADKEVDLVARVDGYQISHPYDGGQFVKKGTVLFNIEDKNYRDQVVQAQASLETAQSTLKYATARYNAMKEAQSSGAVSDMEVAQAESAMTEAAASVSNARASLQSAQTQLSYCTVRAPFDGHVSTSVYSDGTYLAGAGAPVTLATIYDDKIMTVNFSVEDAGFLSNLQSAIKNGTLDFNAVPVSFNEPTPHEYTAKLSYTAPDVDASTGTLKMQAHIDNAYGELRSGMYANIDLPFRAYKDAILVKDAAIASNQLGKYIYVVNDSNKVVYTPITVGDQVCDSMRIVTKGLLPGQKYVTRALLKVRDGMEVNPQIVK
ncbi:MAG: efflux RND transporter periplasmic adaptor subunit [Bacteroidales bacterium]|nr:efflux RND transporter periplasmic adaptor subunit [Bacteroidales bacterium]